MLVRDKTGLFGSGAAYVYPRPGTGRRCEVPQPIDQRQPEPQREPGVKGRPVMGQDRDVVEEAAAGEPALRDRGIHGHVDVAGVVGVCRVGRIGRPCRPRAVVQGGDAEDETGKASVPHRGHAGAPLQVALETRQDRSRFAEGGRKQRLGLAFRTVAGSHKRCGVFQVGLGERCDPERQRISPSCRRGRQEFSFKPGRGMPARRAGRSPPGRWLPAAGSP